MIATFVLTNISCVFGYENPNQNLTKKIFIEDTSNFLNPEKGWYKAYDTTDLYDFEKLKQNGINTVLLEANLKKFVNSPINDKKLNEIRSAFDMARKYNVSVMFRAAYDFNGKSKSEPKNINTILNHINQLKPIFHENEDILYSVQAGFLGAWGEWHSSYYGNPIPVNIKRTIVEALLEAVPESVTIQLRSPMFIREIFNNWKGNSTLSDSEAFSGSALSRIGFHDDALLSNKDEDGTYVDKGYSRQDELNWTNNHAKTTPFVGESNQVSKYSDPENAVYELNLLHAQLIHIDYHPNVIRKWKNTTYENKSIFDYITHKLGYNFVLKEMEYNQEIKKGGVLNIDFSLENNGFGNLLKEKDFEIILSNGKTTYRAKVGEDSRKWYKENGLMEKEFSFSIPSNIAAGEWNLYFSLSSAFDSLKNNPAYSIRFANQNIWDSKTGFNLVGKINIKNETEAYDIKDFKQIGRPDSDTDTEETEFNLPGYLVFHSYSGYDNWDSELKIVDLENKSVKTIGKDINVDHAMNAHFSPDGNLITFMGDYALDSERDWDVFTFNLKTNELKNLTKSSFNGSREEDPKFSPDGSKIVIKSTFWKNGVEGSDLYEIDLDGNIIKRLTNDNEYESMPYYSADGKFIYYARGLGKDMDIYKLNINTGRKTAVSAIKQVQEYYPVTDGENLVFSRWLTANNNFDQLYLKKGENPAEPLKVNLLDENNSDFCPINDEYFAFSGTGRDGKGGYDIFIGNYETGEAFSLDELVEGCNSSFEELGADYILAND